MAALRKNDIVVLSDLDHVLQRPGMYIGSPNEEVQSVYVYEDNKLVKNDLLIIPGLLKIIDEIVDNSVDEAIRTKFQYGTKIDVTYDNGLITVMDNGRGLPIEQVDGKWVPETIFTQLRAGSNFDDSKRDTIGMNGVGSSLTAIFSKRFLIETCNGSKKYTQSIENSTQNKSKPKISPSKSNYTEISFEPNYDFFNCSQECKDNLPKLIFRRLKNLAFAYPEIVFTFNKTKISAAKLKQYLESIHPVYEMNESPNGRIGLFFSEDDFQQISFVNGANTSRGGAHIDMITNKVVSYLVDFIKKKHKFEVKPADIKNKLFIIFSMRMINPKFDSQTKERLINSNAEIKSIIEELVTEKFLKSVTKNEEILLPIVEAHKLQLQVKENVQLAKLGKGKKIKVAKFHAATSDKMYLFLTEGDSACGSIMAVLGRDKYSFFPLKGKPLNVMDALMSKITDNDEIKNIVTILNLRLDKDIQVNMTHDYVVIATDADADGSHIRALLLAFFHKFAPSLIQENRIKFFRTPIVTAKKAGKIVHYFFTLAEYKEYVAKTTEKCDYTYYKGLGTWKKEDLKYLIKKEGIKHFIQDFEYDETTVENINGWMSKAGIDFRKANVINKQFDVNGI